MRPSVPTVGDNSIGNLESLIAVVEKMRHSCFDIEYHLAEHAIGPAEPAIVVNPWMPLYQER